jgi:hypothetical protein
MGSGTIVYDLRNVVCKNNNYSCFWYGGSAPTRDVTIRAINCDLDNWGVYWAETTITNSKLKRCHSCNIKVIDEDGNFLENALITITDNLGNQIFSELTDANGEIDEQILDTHLYKNATGTTTTVITEYNPFLLTISKSGYRTYIASLQVDDAVNSTISLTQGEVVIKNATLYNCTIK